MAAKVVPISLRIPPPAFGVYNAYQVYDYSAPLPSDLVLCAAATDISMGLTDLERLIARAPSKAEALQLRNVLADYEARVGSLRKRAEDKAESFDFDTKGAA